MAKKANRKSGGFAHGDGYSVQIGNINPNWQICLGTRGKPGTDKNNKSYAMFCLECGHIYGANGSDVHERLCKKCNPDSKGSDLQF